MTLLARQARTEAELATAHCRAGLGREASRWLMLHDCWLRMRGSDDILLLFGAENWLFVLDERGAVHDSALRTLSTFCESFLCQVLAGLEEFLRRQVVLVHSAAILMVIHENGRHRDEVVLDNELLGIDEVQLL